MARTARPVARTTGPIGWTVIASPFGPIHVAGDGDAVVGLELRSTDEAFVTGLRRRRRPSVLVERAASATGIAPGDGLVDAEALGRLDRHLGAVARAVGAYLDGERRALDLQVSLAGLSAWDVRVLEAVREIPFGCVSSYGRVARRIGAPGAARAVGGAVGRNPVGLFIPCHRIIAGDGTLGGYGGGRWGGRDEALELKRALLGHEGVSIPAVDPPGGEVRGPDAGRTLPPMSDASGPS
jgi:methylated-DNA-[protein]-cysteine S-methyltransferase